MESMHPEKAAKIKKNLRAAAQASNIDLALAENQFTFWTLNGPQGYICWSRTSDFSQLDLRSLLNQFWPDSPTILEITPDGDRVILLNAEAG